MSQDTTSDALNMIRNARRAKKETVLINTVSNLLIEILKIMKEKKAIKKYKIDSKEKTIEVTLGTFHDCKAIKPRFTVSIDQFERYERRYLPARDIGFVIVSTNKGLMTHLEAIEAGIGGCLIAYFY